MIAITMAGIAAKMKQPCQPMIGSTNSPGITHSDAIEKPTDRARAGMAIDSEFRTAADFVEYFREHGPSTLWQKVLLNPDDQFQMEGYLAMLVGQRVPHAAPHAPSAQERAAWEQRAARMRAIVE